MDRSFLTFKCGVFFALATVILGAFGAHALEPSLLKFDSVETWDTGIRFQMWHALAMIALSQHSIGRQKRLYTTICFTIGIVFFSGSLYWLALDGPRWLGPVTPLGGLSFIIGWTLLFFARSEN